jgi:TolA-binding protein
MSETLTQALADIEAGRTSITALREEAREHGRMPSKVRDMHVVLLHRLLDNLRDAEARATAAEQDALERQSIARELLTKLKAAEQERDGERGVLAMTVARLGGMVEGHPTHRINFLQRIDALRDIERELDEVKASRDRFVADFLQATKDRDDLSAKLAAAERREAESIREAATQGYRSGYAHYQASRYDEAGAVASIVAALASPSTPSPAPSADPWNQPYWNEERWGPKPSPPPRSAPREAGEPKEP